MTIILCNTRGRPHLKLHVYMYIPITYYYVRISRYRKRTNSNILIYFILSYIRVKYVIRTYMIRHNIYIYVCMQESANKRHCVAQGRAYIIYYIIIIVSQPRTHYCNIK